MTRGLQFFKTEVTFCNVRNPHTLSVFSNVADDVRGHSAVFNAFNNILSIFHSLLLSVDHNRKFTEREQGCKV